MSANWPAPETILARYSPLLRLLYEAFEIAIPKAKAYFDAADRPVDRWLFPGLVRHEVKAFLAGRGHNTEDEEEMFEQANIPNNGLMLQVNGNHFRILKADQGGVPAAGSPARQAYFNFNQLQLAYDNPDGQGHHYVVTWNTDEKFNLARLRLAFPWSGTATSAELRWIVDIPHPALTITPETTPEPAEDLPIQRKEERETGTEGSA